MLDKNKGKSLSNLYITKVPMQTFSCDAQGPIIANVPFKDKEKNILKCESLVFDFDPPLDHDVISMIDVFKQLEITTTKAQITSLGLRKFDHHWVERIPACYNGNFVFELRPLLPPTSSKDGVDLPIKSKSGSLERLGSINDCHTWTKTNSSIQC